MANQLTRSPWVVDTAGASTLYTGRVHVERVRWVGATTAGHQAIIQDPDGNVLWSSKAAGSNNVEADGIKAYWRDGFKVPTLESGTLYIYLAESSICS